MFLQYQQVVDAWNGCLANSSMTPRCPTFAADMFNQLVFVWEGPSLSPLEWTSFTIFSSCLLSVLCSAISIIYSCVPSVPSIICPGVLSVLLIICLRTFFVLSIICRGVPIVPSFALLFPQFCDLSLCSFCSLDHLSKCSCWFISCPSVPSVL